MREAHSAAPDDTRPVDDEVLLTFEQRQKSRYRTVTRRGDDLGWFLARGTVLRDGDRLCCDDGSGIRVVAAAEAISEVRADSAFELARAAYHLGNRHVPLQIEPDRLVYQRDSVLDAMVTGLGLTLRALEQPFNPERGAYHGSAAQGHDAHGHDHAHDHHHD